MGQIKVQFLTTAGCHLCEQAYEMTLYLIKNDQVVANRIILEPIEISNDEVLVESYGIRIPVLVSANGELAWPFEIEDLRSWLVK